MATATPVSPLWLLISEAATTLVKAIIAAIERSMPPEMTTIACATVASASGAAAMDRAWMPVGP